MEPESEAPTVILLPEGTRVITDGDDLTLPEANKTGDHTGGRGPL